MFHFYWIAFIGLVSFLIALDLGIFQREAKTMKVREALLWSFFWVSLALLFNIGIYFIYEYGEHLPEAKSGSKAALEFFTGYLLEKSLSLDNIFVFTLIFSYYRIPLKYQRRILTWGILGAIILRGAMILLGVALIQRFSWMLYIFGAVLIWSGLAFFKQGPKFSKDNFLIKGASRVFPIASEERGGRFFIKKKNQWMMTPVFLALLQIEATDLVFAMDSMPAIFAITLDPFIIFTSNIFAILGLRALYFSLAPLIDRYQYLTSCVALILIFIGTKMLLSDVYHIPNVVSLLAIAALLGGSVFLSIFFSNEKKGSISLKNTIAWLFTFSFRQAKRIVIFLVGTTVLLIGVVLIFFPGPALLIIPLGILILSTEFIWAKRFLKKIKNFTYKNDGKK